MNQEVLLTIKQFKIADPAAAEETYLYGGCYTFANALAKKFHGKLYYLPVENHFVTKIDNDFYDIRGLLNKQDLFPIYKWTDYQCIEPLDASRVYKYCIKGKEILML